MAQDMERQLVDLPVMPLPEPARGKTIIVGSGDSYVAALAAYYLSSGRIVCCHPTDIILNPSIAKGANVYFVSMSGKTKGNILACKSARQVGATTTAITAEQSSPLADSCNNVFVLRFTSAGRSSGTISFTASLLACAQIAGAPVRILEIKSIYAAARKASKLADSFDTTNVVILGDALLYAAAVYGALKFNEIFGSRATSYQLEDFCHAPLFGHRKDQTIILGSIDNDKILRRLKGSGLKTLYVDCEKYKPLDSTIYATFFIQHLTLNIARKKKIMECFFLKNKVLLETSSSIIY